MNAVLAAAVLAIAFVATAIATYWLIPWLKHRGLWDLPNHRSLHCQATPRGGGLAVLIGIAAGIGVAWLAGGFLLQPEILVAVAMVAAVGLADDWFKHVPVPLRLAVQTAAASIVVLSGDGLQLQHLPLPAPYDLALGWLAVPLAILGIVAVTNFFNFLDGIDGFAAAQAAVCGLVIALAGVDAAMTVAGLAICGACAGFLLYNWSPARVFLGDVGSLPLGFLLAALPFHPHSAPPGEFVFLVGISLWFFLADAAMTLLRRMVRGESFWRPHRTHLYQRLVQTGLRHDQVALPVICAAAVLSLATIAAIRWQPVGWQWLATLLGAVGFAVYYAVTVQRERRMAYTAAPPPDGGSRRPAAAGTARASATRTTQGNATQQRNGSQANGSQANGSAQGNGAQGRDGLEGNGVQGRDGLQGNGVQGREGVQGLSERVRGIARSQ